MRTSRSGGGSGAVAQPDRGEASSVTSPREPRQTPSVSVVIPTKDRPAELLRLLATLGAQTVLPSEVIVVDGGDPPVSDDPLRAAGLALRRLRHRPPSAALQRNRGLDAVSPEAAFVVFLDDDVLLEPDSFERMLAFWERAPEDVAGAAMNYVNSPHPGMGWMRRSVLGRRSGLYSPVPGDVARSGWQTAVRNVTEVTSARWLISGAVWWRRAALRAHRFDPFFVGYSYLEDLDFSLGLSRHHALVIVPDARFRHAAAEGGRPVGVAFGRMEVENRLYVVRKHRLSLPHCLAGLALRALKTAGGVLRREEGSSLGRLAGNVLGLLGRRGLFASEPRRRLAAARAGLRVRRGA
jgi:glycosyltransferase involved in cell wall biosynthesis